GRAAAAGGCADLRWTAHRSCARETRPARCSPQGPRDARRGPYRPLRRGLVRPHHRQALTTHRWDAQAYERVSDPQVRWAQPVLDRLQLRGDECVLDAGCGTGRISEQLLRRLPHVTLIALDADPAMIAAARQRLARHRLVDFLVADLLQPLPVEPVDAVLLTDAFHWVI